MGLFHCHVSLPGVGQLEAPLILCEGLLHGCSMNDVLTNHCNGKKQQRKCTKKHMVCVGIGRISRTKVTRQGFRELEVGEGFDDLVFHRGIDVAFGLGGFVQRQDTIYIYI